MIYAWKNVTLAAAVIVCVGWLRADAEEPRNVVNFDLTAPTVDSEPQVTPALKPAPNAAGKLRVTAALKPASTAAGSQVEVVDANSGAKLRAVVPTAPLVQLVEPMGEAKLPPVPNVPAVQPDASLVIEPAPTAVVETFESSNMTASPEVLPAAPPTQKFTSEEAAELLEAATSKPLIKSPNSTTAPKTVIQPAPEKISETEPQPMPAIDRYSAPSDAPVASNASDASDAMDAPATSDALDTTVDKPLADVVDAPIETEADLAPPTKTQPAAAALEPVIGGPVVQFVPVPGLEAKLAAEASRKSILRPAIRPAGSSAPRPRKFESRKFGSRTFEFRPSGEGLKNSPSSNELSSQEIDALLEPASPVVRGPLAPHESEPSPPQPERNAPAAPKVRQAPQSTPAAQPAPAPSDADQSNRTLRRSKMPSAYPQTAAPVSYTTAPFGGRPVTEPQPARPANPANTPNYFAESESPALISATGEGSQRAIRSASFNANQSSEDLPYPAFDQPQMPAPARFEQGELIAGEQSYCGEQCEEGCCFPMSAWQASADMLFMQRNHADGKDVLLNCNCFKPKPFTSNDAYLCDGFGYRVGLAHKNCCGTTYDMSFFQVGDFDQTVIYKGGATALGHYNIGVGQLCFHYESDLYNFEANIRKPISPWLCAIYGFRGIVLNESAEIFGGGTLIPWFDRSIDTDNTLLGGQVGLDYCLWDNGGCLQVGVSSKLGVYNNHIELTPGGYTGVDSHSEDVVAVAGDFELQASWQFSPCWALTGGYYLLWMNNVALAPENFSTPDTINHSGDVLMQGGTLGLTYTW